MKPNFTPALLLRSTVLSTIFILSSLVAFCQPDYDFRNSSLVSGTDLQVNAVYLFHNVKTGVDATVTIKDITGGIVLSDIDGPSGYTEAFQPILQVPAHASGYVEFEINFLVAGTNTPMIQTEVPATPIDVDGQTYGDGLVNEFDVLQLTNGYVDYDMLGGELNMNISSPWVTGINVLGIDYPAVDTAPRQVMFTTVNAAISKFTFRTGATSMASGSHQRLRSVYFKKFFYHNSVLPATMLSSFTGVTKTDRVVLNWKMLTGNSIKKAIVERSDIPGQFTPIGDIIMTTGTTSATIYDYIDYTQLQGTAYYRLKLVSENGNVQYSNVLLFRADNTQKVLLKIYPSLIIDKATVNIIAEKNEQTKLQVFDLNGRVVYQLKVQLSQGNNSFQINDLGILKKGTYIASVITNGKSYGQKLMVQ